MKNQIIDYLEDLKNIINSFPVGELDEIINVIIKTHDAGKKFFVMGNGGSAATASHITCDINKGVGYRLNKRIKVICLNDNIPTVLAYANDISFEDVFVEQLKNFIEKGDLIIAISASGRSKNILKAVKFANSHGAITVGLTGGDGGGLARISNYSIIVKSHDTQKIEDGHMIIAHILMQVLAKKLSGST